MHVTLSPSFPPSLPRARYLFPSKGFTPTRFSLFLHSSCQVSLVTYSTTQLGSEAFEFADCRKQPQIIIDTVSEAYHLSLNCTLPLERPFLLAG